MKQDTFFHTNMNNMIVYFYKILYFCKIAHKFTNLSAKDITRKKQNLLTNIDFHEYHLNCQVTVGQIAKSHFPNE